MLQARRPAATEDFFQCAEGPVAAALCGCRSLENASARPRPVGYDIRKA
jgi:hypothetical protein